MTYTSMQESTVAQLAALRETAGLLPLAPQMDGTGWIAVTGADRVRWLNGMVTNSVQALAPGEGAYCFLLNAQGRIQGDCTVWAEPDRLLLQTSAGQVEPVTTLLDRFIIMDDVELANSSSQWHGLLIAGPDAVKMLQSIGIPARDSKLLKRQRVTWHNAEIMVVNAHSPLTPRFELWFSDSTTQAVASEAMLAAGVLPCSGPAFELLRILEGTPRFGTDLCDRDLPQETAQTRALHFNKGCYLGQEIVERIRSRGNVHRTFTQFILQVGVPEPGTPLHAEGKPVGELTSIAPVEIDGQRLALGFVRREAMERGLPLTYPDGHAEPRASGSAS